MCLRLSTVILFDVAMSIASISAKLALLSLLSLVSGSAPGDEHEYCVNIVNVDNHPSAREPGRNVLLDTYNYAALVTRVSSFTNPSLETFPPVFQRFDVDGSSPTLVSLLPPNTRFRMKYVHHSVASYPCAFSCELYIHCRNGANSGLRVNAVFKLLTVNLEMSIIHQPRTTGWSHSSFGWTARTKHCVFLSITPSRCAMKALLFAESVTLCLCSQQMKELMSLCKH